MKTFKQYITELTPPFNSPRTLEDPRKREIAIHQANRLARISASPTVLKNPEKIKTVSLLGAATGLGTRPTARGPEVAGTAVNPMTGKTVTTSSGTLLRDIKRFEPQDFGKHAIGDVPSPTSASEMLARRRQLRRRISGGAPTLREKYIEEKKKPSKIGNAALIAALGFGAFGGGAALGKVIKDRTPEPTKVVSSTPSVSTQPKVVVQQPKAEKPKVQQQTKPTYHHDAIKRMIISDEGVRTRKYNDSRGIPTVGIGHNLKAEKSHASFVKAFGETEGPRLRSHVMSGGRLTHKQATSLFDVDYEDHLARTIEHIPNLHHHSPDTQAVLVSGTYRGHVGDSPDFRRLFNSGKYSEAADELLNRKELKNKPARGVVLRMHRDAQVIRNIGK